MRARAVASGGSNRRPLLPLIATVIGAIGVALLCWHQIAQTLDAPIDIDLAYGGGSEQLPRPRGGTAHVSPAGFERVNVSLTHLSHELQGMIATGIILQFVLLAGVLFAFVVVWARTSTGRPFARSVTLSLAGLASLIAVAGSWSEILQTAIGNREVFEAVGAHNAAGYYSTFPGFAFSGYSLLLAVVVGTLASAFAIGARLTKDTEGLV